MNTTKIISASGAIAMTAMLFSGIAAMADRDLSPIGDALAVAAPFVSTTAATSAILSSKPSTARLTGQAVVKVAANALIPSHRQSASDHATISKWNRLTGSPDVQTMLA